ncbi:hypothetical protein Ancab_008379 [Ancistrocladus abbreviatus]
MLGGRAGEMARWNLGMEAILEETKVMLDSGLDWTIDVAAMKQQMLNMDLCSSVGCCQSNVPNWVANITTYLSSYDNHTYIYRFNVGVSHGVDMKAAFVTLLLPAEAVAVPLALPNCPEKCGDLTIPYPFGIGESCFDDSDSSFNLTCNETTGVTTLGRNLEVLSITLGGQIRILQYVAFDCYDQSGKRVANSTSSLSTVNFTISSSHNKLVAIGCDDYVYLKGLRKGTAYWMGLEVAIGRVGRVSDRITLDSDY